MRFQVLGPLEAFTADGHPIALGPRRQRAVVARLLLAGGRVVPADRLVEDLWSDSISSGASGLLQSNISLLRRVLEPDRPPRAPAKVLVSAAPGYALRIQPGDLDSWLFEQEVRQAEESGLARAPGQAVTLLDRALARWQGPAYSEVAAEEWAGPEVVRLDELRAHARQLRAMGLLASGRAAAAAAELEVLVAESPLREESWRLLALALYRSGRQGDALSVLRRARDVLVAELGVDPGPRLRETEVAVLAQDPALDHAAMLFGQAEGRGLANLADSDIGGIARATEPSEHVGQPQRRPDISRSRMKNPGIDDPRSVPRLIGRDGELGTLLDAAQMIASSGSRGAALISGEPGIGKSALVSVLAAELEARGWLVSWGRCPEAEGSPALWPWAQVMTTLDPLVPRSREEWEVLRLGASTTQFHVHRALSGYLARVAETRPLLVVLEDLNRADEATLAALRDLAADRQPAAVFVAGTYRSAEMSEELAETCSTLARQEATRIDLAGLAAADVAVLVRLTCAEVDAEDRADDRSVAAIAARADGNPFYARETARLLASEGVLVATSEVPAGAADVIRRRVARLPAVARNVLRTFAALGREGEVSVLVRAEQHQADEVYDALEIAVVTGLLEEPAPGRVRFAHALVMDTIYGDLPKLRRARLHFRIAEAMEELRPADVGALAHHFAEAATLGCADQAVRYCRAAAVQAEQRFAFRSAVALWARALAVHLLDPRGDRRVRAELLRERARAEQLAGLSQSARESRAEAIRAAEVTGDRALTAAAITAIDTPMMWNNRTHGQTDVAHVELIRRTLAGLPDGESELRARLLATLALEAAIWHDPVGASAAAEEAVALARGLGDASVLAVALNARYYVNRVPGQYDLVLEIGAELMELGRRERLPGVEALGLLSSSSALLARADVDGASALVEAARELAGRYDLREAAALAGLATAAIQRMQGDEAEAVRGFAKVAADATEAEMWDIYGTMTVVRVIHLYQQGRLAEADPEIQQLADGYPDAARPLLAVRAAMDGRPEAVELLREEPAFDYLWLLMQAFRADAAVILGVRDVAEQIYAQLSPYRDCICGGETISMILGPVAECMARLAVLLGKDPADDWRQALKVAQRARAPRWEARARAALQEN
ncbi:hypothetical protein GCM10009555_051450 [Acrocarpospora macrocephala]|uniref:OmpR/PhoB-type domain-containing protein n=1 Tax=Acrocarpospora macrocephala TaxID=150177 RepID=A0A5M3X7C4_9ACTN|nr:BTAD domain-containing putative transcriptional regulator [Acrocarpospora macrocephala]GES16990.1 hypothetical protein Amac_105880 [Acrocarpospora macrocephala]